MRSNSCLLILLAAQALLLVSAAALPSAAPVKPVPALKEIYQNDFLLGVAVGPYVYQKEDKDIGSLVARQFNSLTCENAMKWESLKHIERVTFWGPADKYSWLNSFPLKRTNHPLLFDRAGQPKPAFRAVTNPPGFLADPALPIDTK